VSPDNASQAIAQQLFGNRPTASATDLILAPRELQKLLSDAEKAIAAEEWGEATQALGLVLGVDAENGLGADYNQDYFLVEGQSSNASKSVREVARELLSNLPSEGVGFVDLRFGIEAEKKLRQAISDRNFADVEQIARQFGFTTAGRYARKLTAERAIGDGELLQAARQFEQLMIEPSARDMFGPDLGLLAAACWKSAGQTDKAADALQRTTKRWPNAVLKWNGKPLPAPSDSVSASVALDRLTLGEFQPVESLAKNWLTYNGAADGNAEAKVGLPLPILRWHVEMHGSVPLESALAKAMRDRESQSTAMIASRVPLVVGDQVIVQTYDQTILAIDQRTGKIAWPIFYGGLPVDLARSTADQFATSRSSVPDYLLERVWGQASTGQLSSDGERLYVLRDISIQDAAEKMILAPNINFRASRQQASTNVLLAYSIAAEGKLAWQVGGEDGLVDPLLAGALFLGPPVAFNSQLLVIAEINGEVHIVGLNPETGESLFRQQLVANNFVPIADDAMKRNQACIPAVDSGVIVCPTLSGYLIGLDAGNRSLLWAHKYENSVPAGGRFNQFRGYNSEQFDPFESRSVEPSVIISDGVVIHMPCESDEKMIYALDLATGEKLWEMQRGVFRYVAGVVDGVAMMVGNDRVSGIKINSGDEAFDAVRLDGNELFSGRGVRQGNRFFAATNKRQVVEIDMTTGEILSRARTERPLGNLVSGNGQLLSLDGLELAAYAIRDEVSQNIDELLGENPMDTWALARRGEMMLADGQLESALDTIEKAYRADPENDDIRVLLIKASIEALQSNFAKFSDRVREYDELIQLGPDRRLYLFGLVNGFRQQGELLEAFQSLMEFAQDRQWKQATGELESRGLQIDGQLTVQEDRWVASQAFQLWDAADEETRKQIEQIVTPELERLDGLVLSMRLRDSTHLSRLPAIESVLVRIASELIGIGEYGRAEQLLKTTSESVDPAIASRSNEALLNLYATTERTYPLVRLGQKNDLNDDQIRQLSTDALVGMKDVDKNLSYSPLSLDILLTGPKTVQQWPSGVQPASFTNNRSPMRRISGVPTDVICANGDALKGYRCFSEYSKLVLVDPLGVERTDIVTDDMVRNVNAEILNAIAVDSLLIVQTNRHIFVVDTLQSRIDARPVLWQESFDDMSGDDGLVGQSASRTRIRRDKWGMASLDRDASFQMVGANRDGIYIRFGDELICYDLLRKERLWTRSGLSRSSREFLIGSRIVMLDTTENTTSILNSLDGTLVDQFVDEDTYQLSTIRQVGRYLLQDSKINGLSERSLRLWDPIERKSLFSGDFNSFAKANVIDDSAILIWGRENKITYWNCATNQEFTWDLVSEFTISYLNVAHYDEVLLVLPFGTGSALENSVTMNIRDSLSGYVKVSGPMIALDSQTGKPLWDEPVVVKEFQYNVSQSTRSPLATLTRLLRWEPKDENDDGERTSMALFDVRNGGLIYSSDFLMTEHGNGFQSYVSPPTNSASVTFEGQTLQVTFDSESEPKTSVDSVGSITKSELNEAEPILGSIRSLDETNSQRGRENTLELRDDR
jgi:outer membrane protein assembly factor BamB